MKVTTKITKIKNKKKNKIYRKFFQSKDILTMKIYGYLWEDYDVYRNKEITYNNNSEI